MSAALDMFGLSASAEPSLDADIEQAWREGDLSWKILPYQRETYDAIRMDLWGIGPDGDGPGSYSDPRGKHRKFIPELHRKNGKSTLCGIIASEICRQKPNARVFWGAETQRQVKLFLKPIMDEITADCPEDLRPIWHGQDSMWIWPETKAQIIIGGCEDEAKCNRLRGPACDLFIIDEAGQIGLLDYLYQSVVLWMLSRTGGRVILPSTPATKPGHPFTAMCEAAEAGDGGWRKQTVYDSEAFPPDVVEELAKECGGKHTDQWRREALVERVVDAARTVVPEFNKDLHVRSLTLPKYAYCLTAADPGSRDLFGLVFGYWDFLAARACIQWSWAKRNASTKQVACVVALGEWRLWGRWPSTKMKGIPLRRQDGKDGWIELLADEADEHTCELLREMADTPEEKREHEQWLRAPIGRLTYWGGKRYEQNPHARWTDVALQFVRDMSTEYGVNFADTAKDDADAQRNLLRDAIGGGKVWFDVNAGPVIPHVKNAAWNENRTDYERHKDFGHFDCLAALIYWFRNIAHVKEKNPNAPEHIGKDSVDHFKGLLPAKPLGQTASAIQGALRPATVRTVRGGNAGWRR